MDRVEVEDYALIQRLADTDVEVLKQKGLGYGRSWLKRGGVGAFMMLARKWDRIENIAKDNGYDIFTALQMEEESVLDDIQDLRRYLLLVESEWHNRHPEHGAIRSAPFYGVAPGAIPAPIAPPQGAPRAG